MYRYALQFDIAARNCAEIIRIRQEDDTEHGVPFSSGEIALLWETMNVTSKILIKDTWA